jgi:hypothetical protein
MPMKLTTAGSVQLRAMLLGATSVGLLAIWPNQASAQTASPQTPAAQTAPSSAAPQAQASSDGQKPIMEQAALDALKKATTRIADAKSFSVKAFSSREVPSTQGQMLTFFDTVDVAVKRPDKLHADIRSGDNDLAVFYDGKTVTLADPAQKFYAAAPAPNTLDAFLTEAAQKHSIRLPMADFLGSDPYAVLSKGLTNAYEVGPALIDGAATRHYAFAASGLEYQLWLDAKTDLPRLMSVTYLDATRAPHFTIAFKDWSFRNVADSAFRFSPAKGSAKIEFLPASQ